VRSVEVQICAAVLLLLLAAPTIKYSMFFHQNCLVMLERSFQISNSMPDLPYGAQYTPHAPCAKTFNPESRAPLCQLNHLKRIFARRLDDG